MQPHMRELLGQVSRTFAPAIDLLEEPLRNQVGVAYLVFRVLDDAEDYPLPQHQRGRLFDLLRRWLQGEIGAETVAEESPIVQPIGSDGVAILSIGEIDVALRYLPTMAQHEIRVRAIETLSGMIKWARHSWSFQLRSELHDYAFYVAGVVGILLTNLFQQASSASVSSHARRHEVAFGKGLQFVNFVRGLPTDPGEGRDFFPRENLEVGFSETENAAWLIDEADSLLRSAETYILQLPSGLGYRAFCLLPYWLALATCAEQRRSLAVVTSHDVKISRAKVRLIYLLVRVCHRWNWAVRLGTWLLR